MVWSKACEVGCAIAECSGLQEHFNTFYGQGRHSDYDGPLYLLVCIYGAGYPENMEDMFYFKHPYRAGPPCDECPPLYPLCQPNPFISPDVHAVHAAQENATTAIFGGLCCKHYTTLQWSSSVYDRSLILVFLFLQTTRGRCVLDLTHTLPSGYLEVVSSATPSRVCTAPSSTLSATSSSR